jgi:hypothetical protein
MWDPQARWRVEGGGRALQACGPLVQPPDVFSMPKILKYSRKNHTKFSGNSEDYYFQAHPKATS